MKKELTEKIIQVALRIARSGKGALIIVGGNPQTLYKTESKINQFNIKDDLKLFESLAIMDGAIILDDIGRMINYGVTVVPKKMLSGYGTRHGAGLSASIDGATSFVVSEEDKKIRIIKEGEVVMQIDALEKNVDKNISEISHLLESVGVGTVGTIGFAVVAPSIGLIGLSLIPGVIVFGGLYYLIKKLNLIERLKPYDKNY